MVLVSQLETIVVNSSDLCCILAIIKNNQKQNKSDSKEEDQGRVEKHSLSKTDAFPQINLVNLL